MIGRKFSPKVKVMRRKLFAGLNYEQKAGGNNCEPTFGEWGTHQKLRRYYFLSTATQTQNKLVCINQADRVKTYPCRIPARRDVW